MSVEYGKSKEVGKQIGKAFSKLINMTTGYCDIALNSITSVYSGFSEETKHSIDKINKTGADINTCVEQELKSAEEDENSAEL